MSADRITLTMAQAVDKTGLSDAFIRKAVNKGQLPAVRAKSADKPDSAGRILIFRDDLEAWLRSFEQAFS